MPRDRREPSVIAVQWNGYAPSGVLHDAEPSPLVELATRRSAARPAAALHTEAPGRSTGPRGDLAQHGSASNGPCSMDDLGQRQLEDVGRPSVEELGDEHVDLRLGNHRLDGVSTLRRRAWRRSAT